MNNDTCDSVLRTPQRSTLIIGGALLFGAPACLESATTGATDATAETSSDTTTDTGGDTTKDTTGKDTAVCWEPPEPVDGLLGQACRAEWAEQGLCDSNGTMQMRCRNGVWIEAPPEDAGICWCNEAVACGPEDVVCGAIGFVGIAAAGKERRGGVSVRIL